MRVLAAVSLGGAGHLNPLVPFLDAARRARHDTLVIGPPAMGPMITAAGFDYRAGAEPPESDVAPIRERLPVAPAAEASVLGNRELFGRLATTAMLPSMEEACAQWRPDLVLRDPCEYASAVVAHNHGLRTAQIAISLAEAEESSIEAAAPALEAHAAGLSAALRRWPYLTRFPASLDPSPFPATARYREDPVPARSLPRWWGESDAPLVYVTFGTVLGHMTIAADVYRLAIEAVAPLSTRVLLTVGRIFDRSALGVLPTNVHVEPWVDQANVFPEAALVVTHGGSGTTFGALAAGVPVVVVPVFADQFENGRRVARAGAGISVETTQAPHGRQRRVVAASDATQITDAITAVLSEQSYRRSAERTAAEIGSSPTVDEVLASLFGPA